MAPSCRSTAFRTGCAPCCYKIRAHGRRYHIHTLPIILAQRKLLRHSHAVTKKPPARHYGHAAFTIKIQRRDRLNTLLMQHVRPHMQGALQAVQQGHADAVLATSAAGVYAHHLGKATWVSRTSSPAMWARRKIAARKSAAVRWHYWTRKAGAGANVFSSPTMKKTNLPLIPGMRQSPYGSATMLKSQRLSKKRLKRISSPAGI